MSTYGNNLLAQYYAQSNLTAKSYVRNGLVAIWDGIENAGWSLHDDNANGWMELVSGSLYTPNAATAKPQCLPDGWSFNGTRMGFFGAAKTVSTIECVFKLNKQHNTQIILPQEATGIKFVVLTKDDKYVVPLTYNSNKTACGELAVGVRQSVSIRTGKGWINGEDKTFSLTSNTGYGYSYFSSLAIASYRANNFVDTFNYLDGDIYCIRLYSRSLLSSEILKNYSIDRIRFHLP